MDEFKITFLNAYYNACNTGDPADWMEAARTAKQLYNTTRLVTDIAEERQIQETYTSY